MQLSSAGDTGGQAKFVAGLWSRRLTGTQFTPYRFA